MTCDQTVLGFNFQPFQFCHTVKEDRLYTHCRTFSWKPDQWCSNVM